MSVQSSTAEIIEAIRKSRESGPIQIDTLHKATFDQGTSPTSGLTYYDLEQGAKMLYPVLTPLRNMIPRVSGKGGIQAAWRAVTGINTSGLRIGVSAGNRGAVQQVSTKDYTASYKGIGLEGSSTFEAQYAAQGFDDIRSKTALTTMQATMIAEESIILGGNTSVSLGTTPTPTVAASAGGGALPAQTWSVICVAMSYDGTVNGSVAGGIQSTIVRTNADGSSDVTGGGASKQSASAQVATTGATGSLTASVPAVSGALSYAWFWGAAGSEVLGAISTINSVLIVAPATGTQLASSLGTVDRSTDSLVFDGLLTQAFSAGSGAYVLTMPTGAAGVGTPLTADGAGGVVEIDQVLAYMWENFRLSPSTMWCNSRDRKNIAKKIVSGGSNGLKFEVVTDRDNVGGGIAIREYTNSLGMAGSATVKIETHPRMPQGTILFTTDALPYPLNDVTTVYRMLCRQDYYQIEWPLRTRKYETGVYADETLQHYAPFSMAIITNIANG